MTFPSGAPGGFPGQGPQQPQQPYPGAAPATRGGAAPDLPQILFLAVAGLGLLNLFLGFANLGGGSNFYEAGTGWVPALLFVSGLTAAFNLLPGDQKPGSWPAIFALGATLPFLFLVFHGGELQVGGILVLIFAILQVLGAVGAYLFDAGVIKAPAPQATQYGQQGPYGQQAYGQQFGQPYGQQPQQGSEQPGGTHAPTKFAQPVNQPAQQPTQYASQQGQFYQQQQPEGGQQQKPGTPPSGFGQPGS